MANTLIIPIPAGQASNPEAFPVQGDGSSLTISLPLGFIPISFFLVSAYDSTGANVTANVASSVLSGTNINVTFNGAFSNVVTLTYSVMQTQTPPVTNISGTVSVAQLTTPWVVSLPSTTITGSVAVTQSGPPWIDNLTEVAGISLGIPTAYGTAPSGNVIGVNAFITNTPAVTLVSTTITGTVAVTGTFFQATQPVSGTITANQGTSPWVVSLASTTITGTVAVTQSTSPWVVSLASTTITGTVAATQSGTWNIGTVTTVTAVTAITNALPTGANTIGKVDILGNAGATLDGAINGASPTNVVWHTAAPSTVPAGACSVVTSTALATLNVKASAGCFYGLSVNNTSSTPIYIQFYNTAGTPTLGTGVVFAVACFIGITNIPVSAIAMASFTTGIGIGASTNPTTAAVPSVAPVVTIFYK